MPKNNEYNRIQNKKMNNDLIRKLKRLRLTKNGEIIVKSVAVATLSAAVTTSMLGAYVKYSKNEKNKLGAPIQDYISENVRSAELINFDASQCLDFATVDAYNNLIDQHFTHISDISKILNINPNVLTSLIMSQSNGVSSDNYEAFGLGQIHLPTWEGQMIDYIDHQGDNFSYYVSSNKLQNNEYEQIMCTAAMLNNLMINNENNSIAAIYAYIYGQNVVDNFIQNTIENVTGYNSREELLKNIDLSYFDSTFRMYLNNNNISTAPIDRFMLYGMYTTEVNTFGFEGLGVSYSNPSQRTFEPTLADGYTLEQLVQGYSVKTYK